MLAIRSAPNQGPLTRYGYAIPKRVGSAVKRNLLRRRLREALRLLPLHEGYDVVITVRPEAANVSFHTLRAELILLLRRARLLDIPLPPRNLPQ